MYFLTIEITRRRLALTISLRASWTPFRASRTFWKSDTNSSSVMQVASSRAWERAVMASYTLWSRLTFGVFFQFLSWSLRSRYCL